MRYAIPIQKDNSVILTQPVDIPDPLPNWAAGPLAFLAKMFPDLIGWVRVADDNVSGATSNGDGTYTNPVEPQKPRSCQTLSSAKWKEYAYGILGTIAEPAGTTAEKLDAGLGRYGKIIKDAKASASDRVYGAVDQYEDATNFRQDKVAIFLKVLADEAIVTSAEFNAIIDNWPQE